MLQKYHQDMMDPTRIVVPISSDNKTVLCRVYFRGKGDKLDYAGNTEISINLFAGTKYDPGMPERIGFTLTR